MEDKRGFALTDEAGETANRKKHTGHEHEHR